ncbi:MAG TPA: head GIN domain-containing protein [Gemmata sp.]
MIRWAFRHTLYAMALGFGGLIAWSATRPALEGSGTPATEERDVVGEPTEVVISGMGAVLLVQGPAPAVRVTADDNIVPHLKANTSGKRLTLTTDTSAALKPKTNIRYRVTLPNLTAVTVSGAASVGTDTFNCEKLAVKLSGAGKADLHDLTCRSLALTLSGAGKANVTGTAEHATIKLSGAGTIDATALRVGTAEVQLSGAGKATVWADVLKARVSGAGVVKYKGAPQLEQKVRGAGTIRPLE